MREGEKPVAYWSGLMKVKGGAGKVEVPIPDYFNGTVHVFAAAVSDHAVGIAERKVIAQADYVIQPHVPYFVAPGDEFAGRARPAQAGGH